MRIALGNCWLELRQGDITHEEVDLIVNAANSYLQVGGGVDGAIHQRGGSAIHDDTERRYPEGCPTGSAVISTAGKLAARYVAHAVGPEWYGGGRNEAELLAGAYRRALELAVEHDCRTVATPALSTGVYGYPLPEAARVSLRTVIDFLQSRGRPELVRFVLFGSAAMEAYSNALAELFPPTESLVAGHPR